MKKLYKMLYMAAAVLLAAACSPEEDDIFSDSSANRADAAIAADMQVLTGAANGWLMEYYRRLVCGGGRLGDAMLVAEKAHGTSKGFILRPEASRRGNIPIESLIRDYRLAEQFPADTGAAPRGAIPGESGPDM